jgi:hypothetical protein
MYSQGLVLVDIASGTTVRKYFGLQQSDYQINSCFGGANEQFILSGSEGESYTSLFVFAFKTLESNIRVFWNFDILFNLDLSFGAIFCSLN